MRPIGIFLALLLALSMGCSKGSDNLRVSANVHGRVYLGESTATIPKVTVSIGGMSYRTVTNGEFEFRGLEPGEYVLTAEKGGYITASDTLLLEGIVQHDIRLFRLGSLD